MIGHLDFPSEPLADDLVLLRPWTENDVPGGLMAFADLTVQRFSWPRTTAYTEADARDLLQRQNAALGYWLRAEARGRGVATRAVGLLAGWAFSDLHVARLELSCSPDNEASQRVAHCCGFVREGLLRSNIWNGYMDGAVRAGEHAAEIIAADLAD